MARPAASSAHAEHHVPHARYLVFDPAIAMGWLASSLAFLE